MFCKAPFTTLMGSLKHKLQVQLYYICAHYICYRLSPLDTGGKYCYRTYLKKVLVTTR